MFHAFLHDAQDEPQNGKRAFSCQEDVGVPFIEIVVLPLNQKVQCGEVMEIDHDASTDFGGVRFQNARRK